MNISLKHFVENCVLHSIDPYGDPIMIKDYDRLINVSFQLIDVMRDEIDTLQQEVKQLRKEIIGVKYATKEINNQASILRKHQD